MTSSEIQDIEMEGLGSTADPRAAWYRRSLYARLGTEDDTDPVLEGPYSDQIQFYRVTDAGQGSVAEPEPSLLHFVSREGGRSLVVVWRGDEPLKPLAGGDLRALEDMLHQRSVLGRHQRFLDVPNSPFQAHQLEGFESSTIAVETPESVNRTGLLSHDQQDLELEACLERTFTLAAEERFEPGVESSIATALTLLQRRFPASLWQSLKRRLANQPQDVEVAAETLRWAGRVALSGPAHEDRLEFLASGLGHHAPIVRDGAMVGLGCVDDPVALTYLKAAVERELIPELREDMGNVIDSFGT